MEDKIYIIYKERKAVENNQLKIFENKTEAKEWLTATYVGAPIEIVHIVQGKEFIVNLSILEK